ncbi:hypothetical protein HAX54_029283, partial [Datura stramonium]|nr:hypothetical protein [Datura stramonium]MCD9642454.1 hypothetical protein [Datura stramonium]
MDDYSGDHLESDAKNDGRDMYYKSCVESSGYDYSNTGRAYDESHQIYDLSKTHNLCNEYYSDESFDHDEISYGDESAYVGVES